MFKKITSSGVVSTFVDTGSFTSPISLAIDSEDKIYVTDSDYTVKMITTAGIVSTLAGLSGTQDYEDDTGAAARFFNPFGIAVDSTGKVYVTEPDKHTIRMIE